FIWDASSGPDVRELDESLQLWLRYLAGYVGAARQGLNGMQRKTTRGGLQTKLAQCLWMLPSGETRSIALAVLRRLRSVASPYGYLTPFRIEICVIRAICGYD